MKEIKEFIEITQVPIGIVPKTISQSWLGAKLPLTSTTKQVGRNNNDFYTVSTDDVISALRAQNKKDLAEYLEKNKDIIGPDRVFRKKHCKKRFAMFLSLHSHLKIISNPSDLAICLFPTKEDPPNYGFVITLGPENKHESICDCPLALSRDEACSAVRDLLEISLDTYNEVMKKGENKENDLVNSLYVESLQGDNEEPLSDISYLNQERINKIIASLEKNNQVVTYDGSLENF
jgi:hypothetical protein